MCSVSLTYPCMEMAPPPIIVQWMPASAYRTNYCSNEGSIIGGRSPAAAFQQQRIVAEHLQAGQHRQPWHAAAHHFLRGSRNGADIPLW